jgi:thioredoxin 1
VRPTKSRVKHVESDEEYNALEGKEKRIIKCSADWCRPCKQIAPYFEELAAECKDTDFISLDVDECPDTAKNLNTRALPTFVVLDGDGKELTRLVGADRGKLKALVKSHCT